MKSLIRRFLGFIDKHFHTIPKLYCSGCLENDCHNRTKQNHECFGYVKNDEYRKRIEYVKRQFKENNISYKLCNESNGHFNLYKNNKVVMSFWSWTGKCYIPSTGYSENIGIKNCIKKYKKLFGDVK